MKLKQAIELLQTAAAIILPDEDGSPVMYPSIHDDEDNDDYFLTLSWSDDEENSSSHNFLSKDNADVQIINGSLMTLKNDLMETISLQLLEPMHLMNVE